MEGAKKRTAKKTVAKPTKKTLLRRAGSLRTPLSPPQKPIRLASKNAAVLPHLPLGKLRTVSDRRKVIARGLIEAVDVSEVLGRAFRTPELSFSFMQKLRLNSAQRPVWTELYTDTYRKA